MERFVQVIYVVKLVALVLAVALALVAARRQTRRRRYNSGKLITSDVLALLALAALALATGAPVSWIALGVGLLIGFALGFAAGRGSGLVFEGGGAHLKRSAAGPLVLAVALVLVAATLTFGSAPLLADVLALLALAVGMMFGQTAAEMRKASSASQDTAPLSGPGDAHQAG